MEFKSLTNIESSFKRIRLMLAAFASCCALVTVYRAVAAHTALRRSNARKSMCWTAASRSCWPFRRISHRTVLAEAREHVSAGSMNSSSACHPRKTPSSTISTVRCNWQTRVPITIMWILPKRGITTVLFQATSTRRCGWTASSATFPPTLTRPVTYARQMIIRQSNVTERSAGNRLPLQNTSRSDDNPNGFIIEHLTVLENKDMRSAER